MIALLVLCVVVWAAAIALYTVMKPRSDFDAHVNRALDIVGERKIEPYRETR